MGLERTNLIMEFGPYGPSGMGGGSGTGGAAVPISARRFNTWPFVPNAKLLMQKEKERQRRRDRLRQLALGWFMNGGAVKSGSDNGSSGGGAAPGSIF